VAAAAEAGGAEAVAGALRGAGPAYFERVFRAQNPALHAELVRLGVVDPLPAGDA
jgi:hypothetical protein